MTRPPVEIVPTTIPLLAEAVAVAIGLAMLAMWIAMRGLAI